MSVSSHQQHHHEHSVVHSSEEIEQAFYHLMYQFRQINYKYGLMVREEINEIYINKLTVLNSIKKYDFI